MLRYVLNRLLVAIPLLIGLVVISFLYVHVLPGDPVGAMLGVNRTPELEAQLREKFGLDQPLVVQFWNWVTGLLRGDFGLSFRSQQPVSELIAGRLPAALQLGVASFVIMLLVGIGLGTAAGLRPGGALDRVITSVTLVGLSIPTFALGVALIVVGSIITGWLPSSGYVPFAESPVDNIRSLILPALTLGVISAPPLVRLTRQIVIETSNNEFVRYARSRGLSRRTIVNRYVLRNSWPQLISIVGLSFGLLLGGSIIAEQLFAWPGTGQLLFSAVEERDYAMIQAAVLLYGGLFIALNLLTEVLQGVLDPRIRLK